MARSMNVVSHRSCVRAVHYYYLRQGRGCAIKTVGLSVILAYLCAGLQKKQSANFIETWCYGPTNRKN